MTVSTTCPDIRTFREHIEISHHDEYLTVNMFDIDALIDDLTKLRDRLNANGIRTRLPECNLE
jgi:hypothetical protein